MKTNPLEPARLVAQSLGSAPALSAETIVQRFLIRWKLFTLCALVVPLVAVTLSHFVPPTFQSSAQILIRHQGGPNSLYSEISLNQVPMSGASIAEILRSAPVSSQMIEDVGVEDADVARPAVKVLFGKVAAVVMPLFGRDAPDPAGAGDSKLKYLALARELKPSIEASTLMMERGGVMRDELIEVKLKSTNREKVAAMVNGLCEAFIAEHKRRSRDEILGANKTLGEQAGVVEAELERLHQSISTGASVPATEFGERIDNKPFSSSLARTLSELELRVLQLKQNYTELSPALVQAQAELDRARALLANQEAVDAARDTLNTIKKRLRQLLVAARVTESNQSNISIVERGLTPRKTKMTQIIRYAVPLIGGLAAGSFLGLVGVALLNLIDPRLYLASDVPTAAGLPLVGVVPRAAATRPAVEEVLGLPYPGAQPALLQVIGKLDLLPHTAGRVLVLTTAENEAPSASLALQLSALLAREGDGRVLLVDAMADPTAPAAPGQEGGLRAVLLGQQNPDAAIRPTKSPRLFLLGLGATGPDEVASPTRESWLRFLEYSRRQYGTTVLHVGGLLNSRDAAFLAKAADAALVVTQRKSSRKDSLGRAGDLLREIGANGLGVIHCGVCKRA